MKSSGYRLIVPFSDKLKISFLLLVLLLSLLTLYKPFFFVAHKLFVVANLSITITGWILTFSIITLSVYSLKKRFLIMRFGTLALWYDFHIYCGALTLFLIPLHSGFLVGKGLSFIIFVSIYIVMATGIYGIWIQQVVPAILLKKGAETMDYKNLVEKEEALKRKIDLLSHENAEPEFRAALSESGKNDYLLLNEAVQEKNIIHQELRLIGLMNRWLSFHIASVVTLLVFISIHIFSYYYY